MTEEKTTFFVGINSARDLRKEILESSKGLIMTLRRYEHMKDIRRKKVEYLIELRKIIKEIDFLDSKLKAMFPKTKLRASPKREAPAKKGSKKKAAPKKKTDMEKLEDQLRTIESKLGTLD